MLNSTEAEKENLRFELIEIDKKLDRLDDLLIATDSPKLLHEYHNEMHDLQNRYDSLYTNYCTMK